MRDSIHVAVTCPSCGFANNQFNLSEPFGDNERMDTININGRS